VYNLLFDRYLEEQENITEAANIYKELLNDLEEDGQHHVRSEVVTQYATLLVKIKKFTIFPGFI